jgi:hypothetical protein
MLLSATNAIAIGARHCPPQFCGRNGCASCPHPRGPASYQWIKFLHQGRIFATPIFRSLPEPMSSHGGFSPIKPQVMIMKRITLTAAGLALLAGIVSAHAQGIGYGPGVNPSNPQDLIARSNPQDLTLPGGSNRQDLVRRPPSANVPTVSRPRVTSAPRASSQPALRSTVKSKPKKKKVNRRSAERR